MLRSLTYKLKVFNIWVLGHIGLQKVLENDQSSVVISSPISFSEVKASVQPKKDILE